ncbi:response regulator transcription factor [Siphonobacter curvatus]|uniref:Helix-turn-helix transcriptional regulator n=1 Tax=Siphonobacter curvatus TaxID=2094562 RepID=A0A2S7IMV6_9BACT|nr:LuxR C-terminal-related transcriptional regulator [Siphonobacter curvatus]PQA59057.1 helix-turn-helix transcriptional regulator [Siphonobacter curvatus]
MWRSFLSYGLVLGLLLSLLAWSKYRWLMLDHTTEIYVLVLAGVFIGVGIWVGLRWMAPQVIEKEVIQVYEPLTRPIPEVLEKYGISVREWEVLMQVSKGLSNEEIAEKLFVSTNTVKTHLGNLYAKLEVKRRTQAVEKARLLGLLQASTPPNV